MALKMFGLMERGGVSYLAHSLYYSVSSLMFGVNRTCGSGICFIHARLINSVVESVLRFTLNKV